MNQLKTLNTTILWIEIALLLSITARVLVNGQLGPNTISAMLIIMSAILITLKNFENLNDH